MPNSNASIINRLKEKSDWARRETLKIHKTAPGTRVASSLSCVEILVVLYYGEIIKHNPANIDWDGRDRLIISKGHGSITFYPILADFGYFDKKELDRICKDGALLGSIPDCAIAGFETTNGSLGHGLGVACGKALALKRKGKKEKVFVILGDGELYEGAVWEALMFAGGHKLDNLILIVDNNKVCMLNFCKNVLDLEPLEDKFKAFHWNAKSIDGHNVEALYNALKAFKEDTSGKPKVLIANTIKGKGVPTLETDSMNHVRTLKPDEVEELLNREVLG